VFGDIVPSISASTFFNPFALAFTIPFLPFSGINSLSRFFTGKDLEDYIQKRTGISNAILDVVPFET
jgi:hypothetical protein